MTSGCCKSRSSCRSLYCWQTTSICQGPNLLECSCVALVPAFYFPLKLLILEGQQLRYCGYGAKHDDVFIKGDPNDLKVFGYFLIQSPLTFIIQQVHRVLHQGQQSCSCCKVITTHIIHA
jgi:hypothetical protein